MSSNQEKNAARRSLALNFKDGLWDILLGGFFILLAIQEPLEQRGLEIWASYMPALLTMGLGIPIYALLKKKVVIPRIGLVKIGFRSNPARRWLLGLAIGLQLITLAIFILGYTGWLGENMPEKSGWLIDVFFGVAIFGFFAYIGYIMDAPRYYFYGLLLGLSPSFGVLLDIHNKVVSHIPVLFAGLVMVIGGVVTLISFLKAYPLVEQEVVNG
jgi:hypothetical protein